MHRVQRLDAVCEILMGQAPDGDAYNDEKDGWPLIAGAGDFGDLYPAPKKYTTEASKLSKAGDIILGIRATIGEKVLSDGEYCLGRGVAGLRAKANLDARYLWHWIEHIRPSLAAKGKGATFKQVNKQDIGELEIVLPPLPEQRRIAAILDQADALRAKRREALAQLDSLTQSIFIGMSISPSFKARQIAIADCTEAIIDYRGKTPKKTDTGVPLITARVVKGGEILEPNEFIAENDYDSWMRRGLPKNGDVLFTTEAPLGEVAQLNDRKVALAQRLLLLRGKQSLLDNTFLRFALVSEGVRKQIQARATGSTVTGIRQSELRKVKIPVPPLTTQREFATQIRLIESLRSSLRSASAGIDSLFASLQHRAFRGEL